jgi:hypothetical protein
MTSQLEWIAGFCFRGWNRRFGVAETVPEEKCDDGRSM